MRHSKWMITILTTMLLILAACSAAEPVAEDGLVENGENGTQNELPPTAMPTAVPIETGEEADSDAGTAETQPESDEEAIIDESNAPIANLPKLPSSFVSQGGGPGAGGGGGDGSAAMAESSVVLESADLSIFEPYDVFSGTNFVLQGTPSVELAAAPVWRHPEFTMTYEYATQLAQRLGFPGPLYQEMVPVEARGEIDLVGEGIWRSPFYAFDGGRILTISGGGAFIENRFAANVYNGLLSYEEGAAMAEAQIIAWGGVDFEYELANDGPGNISLRRLINGQPVDFPEMYFHFNDLGEPVFTSFNITPDFENIGDYPLISSQQAWSLILDGVIENQVLWQYLYSPEMFEPVLEPIEPDEEYQYWYREYPAGADVVWYGYPRVYLPAQDDGEPLVVADQFAVTMSLEDVMALSQAEGYGEVALTGTMSADGRTLQVSSWEAVAFDSQLYLEGVVSRADSGAVELQTLDNLTYVIKDAPADLADGTRVYAYGFVDRSSDSSVPEMDWLSIDKVVFYEEEALPTESEVISLPVEPGFDPFSIEEVVITDVKIGYYYMPLWPEYVEGQEYVEPAYDLPSVMLQPMWQFVGTTSHGEGIMFSVPAVDPAYFE